MLRNINAEWAPNQADPEPSDQHMIRRAMDKCYTQEVWAESDEYTLNLLVKPGTDMDSRFRAFCLDEFEWLTVSGSLFSIERA